MVRVSNFGQWLLVKRMELRLTQKQVADAIGVRSQSISNWEKGEVIARLNTDQVKRLCALMGCSKSEIPSEGLKIIKIE